MKLGCQVVESYGELLSALVAKMVPVWGHVVGPEENEMAAAVEEVVGVLKLEVERNEFFRDLPGSGYWRGPVWV